METLQELLRELKKCRLSPVAASLLEAAMEQLEDLEDSYDLGYEDMADKAYNTLAELREYAQQIADGAKQLQTEPGVSQDNCNAAALGYLTSGVRDILRSLDRTLGWLARQAE